MVRRISPGDAIPTIWCVPGQERTAHGRYVVGEDGRPQLELHENLTEWDWLTDNEPSSYPAVVHGDAMGMKVTAIDLQQRSYKFQTGTPLSYESYRANYFVEGAHLDPDELTITDARFHITDQDIWTNTTSINPKFATSVSRGPESIQCTLRPTVTAIIKADEVSLEDVTRFDPNTRSYVDRTHFVTSHDQPISIIDWSRYYLDSIAKLLTIAGNHPVHPDEILIKIGTGKTVRLRPGWKPPEPRSGEAHATDYLFCCSDLYWSTQLPQWFEFVSQCSYATDLLATMAEPSFHWASLKMVSLAQAAESIHQARYEQLPNYDQLNELISKVDEILSSSGLRSKDRRRVRSALKFESRVPLSARLNQLCDAAGESIGEVGTNCARWTGPVATMRNDLSHGNATADQFRSNLVPLQLASWNLQYLLRGIILQQIGFDMETARRLLNEHRNSASIYRAATTDIDQLLTYGNTTFFGFTT